MSDFRPDPMKTVREHQDEARAEERERCAKLCDQMEAWERKRCEAALAHGNQTMAAREAKLIELTARDLAYRIRKGP